MTTRQTVSAARYRELSVRLDAMQREASEREAREARKLRYITADRTMCVIVAAMLAVILESVSLPHLLILALSVSPELAREGIEFFISR